MKEKEIKFISDIFESFVVAGSSCLCTYMEDNFLLVSKVLSVQV